MTLWKIGYMGITSATQAEQNRIIETINDFCKNTGCSIKHHLDGFYYWEHHYMNSVGQDKKFDDYALCIADLINHLSLQVYALEGQVEEMSIELETALADLDSCDC